MKLVPILKKDLSLSTDRKAPSVITPVSAQSIGSISSPPITPPTQPVIQPITTSVTSGTTTTTTISTTSTTTTTTTTTTTITVKSYLQSVLKKTATVPDSSVESIKKVPDAHQLPYTPPSTPTQTLPTAPNISKSVSAVKDQILEDDSNSLKKVAVVEEMKLCDNDKNKDKDNEKQKEKKKDHDKKPKSNCDNNVVSQQRQQNVKQPQRPTSPGDHQQKRPMKSQSDMNKKPVSTKDTHSKSRYFS